MSNQFYVVLPSIAGEPGSKTNRFTIQFPKKLQFDGQGWQV